MYATVILSIKYSQYYQEQILKYALVSIYFSNSIIHYEKLVYQSPHNFKTTSISPIITPTTPNQRSAEWRVVQIQPPNEAHIALNTAEFANANTPHAKNVLRVKHDSASLTAVDDVAPTRIVPRPRGISASVPLMEADDGAVKLVATS